MHHRNGNFCTFSVDMLLGKCGISFSLTTKNIGNEIISCLGQVEVFQRNFFETIDCDHWWRREDLQQSR